MAQYEQGKEGRGQLKTRSRKCSHPLTLCLYRHTCYAHTVYLHVYTHTHFIFTTNTLCIMQTHILYTHMLHVHASTLSEHAYCIMYTIYMYAHIQTHSTHKYVYTAHKSQHTWFDVGCTGLTYTFWALVRQFL